MTGHQVIDLDHLNRYTGGDPALNVEILRLFADQCTTLLARLEALANEDGAGSKSWHEATHALKGAARGVGAFALGDVAAEAEKIKAEKEAAQAVVHRLKNRACAVQLFVDQYSKK
jgi:HPt (histidine-containing phosphotransfer) domain-containing protein